VPIDEQWPPESQAVAAIPPRTVRGLAPALDRLWSMLAFVVLRAWEQAVPGISIPKFRETMKIELTYIYYVVRAYSATDSILCTNHTKAAFYHSVTVIPLSITKFS
jgi:hypothetical protein